MIALLRALALLLVAGNSYAAADTTNEFITGVLGVPFKWHVSDKNTTVGSTVGGYLGYQMKTYHDLTITPIIGGGLALIDQSQFNSQSSTLKTGVSVAFGLVGRVGSTGTRGVQLGVIAGCDWLGKGQHYQYEGKPWIAFEVGYNFSL